MQLIHLGLVIFVVLVSPPCLARGLAPAVTPGVRIPLRHSVTLVGALVSRALERELP